MEKATIGVAGKYLDMISLSFRDNYIKNANNI